MEDKQHITSINLEEFSRGRLYRVWLDIITNSFGEPISIPLLIGRGSHDGPVIGITAAIHGNELNGIPVIQRLFKEIENETIHGTVIGIPVVNVLAFDRRQRRFIDGVDLNHIMPGKKDGNVSQVYAHRLIDLIDLHTASKGRINSYYIRADLDDPVTDKLARLQHAQIVVHNPPHDGTLRGAAESLGIPAITLEVGNPSTYQKGMISSGTSGLLNALIYLRMVDGNIDEADTDPIICDSSKWIFTDRGGLLSVHPSLTEIVKAGDVIATQRDIFGDVIKEYVVEEDGIVIGKSVNPVNQSGGRILHLGKIRS